MLLMNTSVKMTSLEIAKVTEKRHDNVIRDIKKLIKRGAISLLKIEVSDYETRGKTYTMHSLDFESTMVLMTGYRPVLRAKVISRWLELEKAAKPELDFQNPTHLQGLVDGLAKQGIKDKKKIAKLKPKAKALKVIACSKGTTGITVAAKTLNVKPRKTLFPWLIDNNWIYKFSKTEPWIPYQAIIDIGYMVQIEITKDGYTTNQARLTNKGLAKLAELI